MSPRSVAEFLDRKVEEEADVDALLAKDQLEELLAAGEFMAESPLGVTPGSKERWKRAAAAAQRSPA